MADPTPTPAVSPTGQAILPAKYVPYALAIATVPGAVAGVLHSAGLFPQTQAYLAIASGLLWALLGVISPGLRRSAAALLVLVLVGLSAPARAQAAALKVEWHLGLTPSLTELRFNGQVLEFAPGLGVRGFARYKNLDAGLTAFGSALVPFSTAIGLTPPGDAKAGYAFSGGPLFCHNKLSLCAGAVWDFAKVDQGVSGLLHGFTWKDNFSIVVSGTEDLLKAIHLLING